MLISAIQPALLCYREDPVLVEKAVDMIDDEFMLILFFALLHGEGEKGGARNEAQSRLDALIFCRQHFTSFGLIEEIGQSRFHFLVEDVVRFK